MSERRERREKLVALRVTQAEWTALERAAEAEQRPPSTFARLGAIERARRVLSELPPPKVA